MFRSSRNPWWIWLALLWLTFSSPGHESSFSAEPGADPDRGSTEGALARLNRHPLPVGAVKRYGRLSIRTGSQMMRMSISSDERLLAARGLGGTIGIWELSSGEFVGELPGKHFGSILFFAAGTRLASFVETGGCVVWDIAAKKPLYELPSSRSRNRSRGPPCVCVSEDGKKIATTSPASGKIHISNAATGELLREFDVGKENGGIWSVIYSSDSKDILTVLDDSIYGWNVNSGVKSLDVGIGYQPRMSSLFDRPNCIVAPTGKRIAVWGDGVVSVRDLADTAEDVIKVDKGVGFRPSTAFSHDGKWLAYQSSDEISMQIVSLESKKRIASLSGATTSVNSVEFSKGGRYLAALTDYCVHVWDMGTRKELPFTVGPDLIWQLGFSPEGDLLAVEDTGGVRIWNVRSGRLVHYLEGVHGIIFEPGGKITTLADSGLLETRDVDMGNVTHFQKIAPPLSDEELWNRRVARESAYVCGSDDGSAVAFDISGRPLSVFDRKKQSVVTLTQKIFVFGGLSFFPGPSRRLLRATTTWDLAARKEGRRYLGRGTVISKSGNQIASIKDNFLGARGSLGLGGIPYEGRILVWETDSDRKERAIPIQGWIPTISAARMDQLLAISPDGDLIAVAGSEGGVHLLDFESGTGVHVFRGHLGPVTSVVFSADGRLLASAGQDMTAVVWNLADLKKNQANDAD